jgi:hypothetical protein
MEQKGSFVVPSTSVELWGLRIDEPVTALTDLVVSAVCFIAFYKLHNSGLPGKTQMFLRVYFLLMGVATCFGGVIGHAFLYAFSFAWKLPGWIVSMLSVALIERSSIGHAQPFLSKRVGTFFLRLNIVELVTVMTITVWTLNFRWVEFHSGYGLLAIVLPFHLFVYYKTRDRGSLIFIFAVLIASVAALIFMNRISLDRWFNHLDISHTLMAVAGIVFYKGALALRNNY